jgi:hypothetical protein
VKIKLAKQDIIIPDPTKPQAAPAPKDDKAKAAKISGGKGGKP